MRRLAEIAASALALFVAGYALWPPGKVYWAAVAEVIGPIATIAIVFVVAGLFGVVIASLSEVGILNLAVGGAIAYVVGMALVESLMTPDSPVHFYVYGAYLGCALVGAVASRQVGGQTDGSEREPTAR